jgi:Flp pilus assembly protein TadD
MKKLITMMLGLSMVLGTATMFGADTATKKASTKKSATKAPKPTKAKATKAATKK